MICETETVWSAKPLRGTETKRARRDMALTCKSSHAPSCAIRSFAASHSDIASWMPGLWVRAARPAPASVSFSTGFSSARAGLIEVIPKSNR